MARCLAARTGAGTRRTLPCLPRDRASKIANPLILIDEIEKAGTRSDYGRLWIACSASLSPRRTAAIRIPPLQTNLDLSQVSYVATANSLDPCRARSATGCAW